MNLVGGIHLLISGASYLRPNYTMQRSSRVVTRCHADCKDNERGPECWLSKGRADGAPPLTMQRAFPRKRFLRCGVPPVAGAG